MTTCQPAIYQLKVALKGIRPMIRRHLPIRDDTTITDYEQMYAIVKQMFSDRINPGVKIIFSTR